MMRTRILWALVVLVVLGLIAVVAANTYWSEATVPAPLGGDAARNPFYAAEKLAAALGASTARQSDLVGVESDAVVVLSSFGWNVSSQRRAELERWVEAGGRLVVDASLIVGGDVFESWSGIGRVVDEVEDDDSAAYGQPGTRCANTEETVASGDPSGTPRRVLICGVARSSRLETQVDPIWVLEDDTGGQAVRVRVGRGSVTAVNAEPFRYRDLLEADHGVLFAAATQLASGDRIVFVSEGEPTSLLGLVWRYGAPFVVVLLLWIAVVLWRGAVRFGPSAPTPEGARRSLAEQIRGTGRFTARLGGGAALHAAALRALREASVRYIANYERLAPDAQLAAVAAAAAMDPAELAGAFHYSARRSSELRASLALLEAARRQLTLRNQ